MERLQQLYQDYREKAREVRQKSSAFADFFGTGASASRNPCHEKFYYDVESWVKEFVAPGPDAQAAAAVAAYILQAPQGKRKESCYWFMYVCINFIDLLLPFLGERECDTLARQFAQLYKKRERMPAQEAVFKSLCKKAGLDSRKLK